MNFGYDYARNVILFGVDNSSSPHADNLKNSFLVLVKEILFALMEDLVHQKKTLALILVKQTQKFA